MRRRDAARVSSATFLLLLIILACLPVGGLADAPLYWTQPENLSQTLLDSETPVVAAQANGIVHAVWEEDTVLAYGKNDGSSWASPLTIYVGQLPSVCVEGDTLHIVWVDETEGVQEVLYSRSTQGGWLAPINVSQTEGDSTSPVVAVTSAGTVHVVWSDSTPGYPTLYHAESDNGILWASGPIPNGAGQAPCVAVGARGDVEVAWQDRFLPEEPSHIYYSRWDGDQWSWPVDVSDSPNDATFPSILVDSEGLTHLVWGEVSGNVSVIRHSLRDRGGFWTIPEDLSPLSVDAWVPRLALCGSDEIVVAWNEADALAYRVWDPEEEIWLARDTIVQSTAEVNELAIAASGQALHVVWTAPGSAGRDVFYSRGSAGAADKRLYLPLVLGEP